MTRPMLRPRPGRHIESSTTQQSAEGRQQRTRGTKRKASPEERTDNKREKATGDLRVNTHKRKVRADSLSHRDKEEPCSSFDINSGKSGKRKRKVVDEEEQTTKRLKTSSTVGTTTDSEGRQQNQPSSGKRKRKAADDEEIPTKRLRTVPDEERRRQTAEAAFQAKYQQQDRLGAGGCGCVYAGYRRADNLPVAIKRIPQDSVMCKHTVENGVQTSVEVAVMQKLSGAAAAVELLDWYHLGTEIIVVMERPIPAMDMLDYINIEGGCLEEDDAKVILRQLVDAAKTLEDQKIFHRDIKTENILIETGSDTPRVRLIDFGMSCFFKKRSCYREFYGTPCLAPPEFLRNNTYRAGPTTAWQIGIVLFEALHCGMQFDTKEYLRQSLTLDRDLSEECHDFLRMCLMRAPEKRATLEQLQRHPWLR